MRACVRAGCIGTDGGWVDCESPELDNLDTVLDRYKEEQSSEGSKGIGLTAVGVRVDRLVKYAPQNPASG